MVAGPGSVVCGPDGRSRQWGSVLAQWFDFGTYYDGDRVSRPGALTLGEKSDVRPSGVAFR